MGQPLEGTAQSQRRARKRQTREVRVQSGKVWSPWPEETQTAGDSNEKKKIATHGRDPTIAAGGRRFYRLDVHVHPRSPAGDPLQTLPGLQQRSRLGRRHPLIWFPRAGSCGRNVFKKGKKKIRHTRLGRYPAVSTPMHSPDNASTKSNRANQLRQEVESK